MKGKEAMTITTVTVQMGRTVSKNYNSFQNSVLLTATVADHEDHAQVTRQLQRECHRFLLTRSPFEETE
jgi:hypothetical protein